MPSQVVSSVENNFTKGLVTEFTGLNFPENAATDTDNCTYTLVGDVVRRMGINYEVNAGFRIQDRTNVSVGGLYKWNNAGGDGTTQVVVEQVGNLISFYQSNTATLTSPLSAQLLASQVNLANFTAVGGSFDATKEAQFSDGNGYLFVYHPSCDPIYCTFSAGVVTGNRITVQIRDFLGVPEPGLAVNARPTFLNESHRYNVLNQGWSAGIPWSTTSTTLLHVGTGAQTFACDAGITGLTLGDLVNITYTGPTHGTINVPPIVFEPEYALQMTGTVTAYSGGSMTVIVTISDSTQSNRFGQSWTITPAGSQGYLNTWNAAIGNWPSNSDVWWYYKNSSDVFDPATTISNVTSNTGNAPQGHFILDVFNQQRDTITTAVVTDIITAVRPRTGCWFQGRSWYAGVDASQPAVGTAPDYSWTETIYFSQAIIDGTNFGDCYQLNDPTSETLFDLLPTDGGTIKLQGCGSIYKLFPIQNGLLVFAANGIWFITGSQGIGFSANDYTITKISSVQSISGTSHVNVNGLPYFWNEEGIYTIQPSQQGGLEVSPITYNTIWSFYQEIPVSSKMYARGTFNPLDYTIQWIYKDTEAVNITDRYSFNKILNFNILNKAFFPYTLNIASPHPTLNGIIFVTGPGGGSTPPAHVLYSASNTDGISYGWTFAAEYDTNYTDWGSSLDADYESYLVTGFKLHGDGQRRFQLPYIYVFSRTDEGPVSYKIQGLWDYASTGNSGRWSTAQIVTIDEPDYGMVFRRHKLRGQGLVLQIKIKSVSGEPFDVMGWSTFETVNQGI